MATSVLSRSVKRDASEAQAEDLEYETIEHGTRAKRQLGMMGGLGGLGGLEGAVLMGGGLIGGGGEILVYSYYRLDSVEVMDLVTDLVTDLVVVMEEDIVIMDVVVITINSKNFKLTNLFLNAQIFIITIFKICETIF
jgi:hypothetical protein